MQKSKMNKVGLDIIFNRGGRVIFGAMTKNVQLRAPVDLLRGDVERVWLKGVNVPAGSSAQYQVIVFNMHVHSTNTVGNCLEDM